MTRRIHYECVHDPMFLAQATVGRCAAIGVRIAIGMNAVT